MHSGNSLAHCGSWVLLATIVWGGLFEGKRWAWPLELARMLAATGILLIARGG